MPLYFNKETEQLFMAKKEDVGEGCCLVEDLKKDRVLKQIDSRKTEIKYTISIYLNDETVAFKFPNKESRDKVFSTVKKFFVREKRG
jgi:hypothetical protein